MTPSCTVVIPTRDRPASLAACLQTVVAQRYADLEILVVDSASRGSGVQSVAAAAGASYLRVERPGLSRARNAGAHAARGGIVVFMDDDLALESGCLAALVDSFADPAVVAVGGRVLLSGGDDAARRAFESFGAFDAGVGARCVDRSTPDWFELVNFGGLGTGALIAVRRSVFGAWSGFDERLGRGAAMGGGEELHAWFSLVEQGHRIVYQPRAVARHPGPASLDELRQRMLQGAALGAAYATLLLAEHPPYRRRTLGYVWQALRGRQREWRPSPALARRAVVPRWRERIAWLVGPLLYLRMRLRVTLARD